MSERGSILVGMLWCMVLLSVVVVGVLHTARLDLMVAKNYGDRIQAHYLALAGIEKAKALIYQDAANRRKSRRNHGGQLYDDPTDFREVKFGRGQFSVIRRARPDEGGNVVFGVSDEESRLNVNVAATNELPHLDNMTPDVVAAIIDWRDSDNEVTPGGAERDYYTSLRPPYLPRNGPFQTVRELLMVRGVTSDLLLGKDRNANGLLDNVGGGEDAPVDDDQAGVTEMGWASLLTVNSMEENVNAGGEDRVNIQEADEGSLSAVRGITTDIARAIVAYRGQNKFTSVADLLDVPAAQNGNPGNQGNGGGAQPAGQPGQNNGPKVVSQDLLMDIADDLSVESGQNENGLVNVNTAGLDVLICLPGLDRQTAQAIINFRSSDGFLPNIASLLKVPGITRDVFKQLAPRITVRSETYRILAEGKVGSTGVRQRIQEIVHVGAKEITILSYREDL